MKNLIFKVLVFLFLSEIVALGLGCVEMDLSNPNQTELSEKVSDEYVEWYLDQRGIEWTR